MRVRHRRREGSPREAHGEGSGTGRALDRSEGHSPDRGRCGFPHGDARVRRMHPAPWPTAIRQAREAVGLDPSSLADRAGLQTDRLASIEEGASDVTVGELIALAQALRLEPAALLQGESRREPGARLAFRSRDAGWARLADADLALCERALRSGRSLLEVNERLGRQRSSRSVFEACEPLAEVEQEVRDLAGRVRQHLGNVEGTLPDLEVLFDLLDIVIVDHQFASEDVDAVAVLEAGVGNGAAVVVAKHARAWLHPLRRRVLLAHELCHVLFDHIANGEDAVVDFDVEGTGKRDPGRPDSRYLSQDAPRERRARAFAAEFLMPTSALQKLLGPPRNVHDYGEAHRMIDRVREHFETPMEIAVNQLWNRRFLGPIPNLTSEDPRQDLLEYLRWKGGGGASPSRREQSGSDVLTRRAREAWEQGLCSESEVRRWLGISPFDPIPWNVSQ
ncbi:MAG: helix-turn-helix transcriptional regulator [Polyangiales bacterium]